MDARPASVRCPTCGGVVFRIFTGLADGVCCGRRILAGRDTRTGAIAIIRVDRPRKRLRDSKKSQRPNQEP